MARPRRVRTDGRRAPRRTRALALLLALVAGVGLLGFAYAQTSISLNSPVSFPVDI
ncbi:MAG: hypothetical protein ACPGQ5_08720 [Alphaproteobacteria bacterium]|jgi:hypothetical protein